MILKIGTIRDDDGKAAKAATKMVWAGVWLYSANGKMNKLQNTTFNHFSLSAVV